MKWYVVLSPTGEPICKGLDITYSGDVAEFLKCKLVDWELTHEVGRALPTHYEYLKSCGIIEDFIDWHKSKRN